MHLAGTHLFFYQVQKVQQQQYRVQQHRRRGYTWKPNTGHHRPEACGPSNGRHKLLSFNHSIGCTPADVFQFLIKKRSFRNAGLSSSPCCVLLPVPLMHVIPSTSPMPYLVFGQFLGSAININSTAVCVSFFLPPSSWYVSAFRFFSFSFTFRFFFSPFFFF